MKEGNVLLHTPGTRLMCNACGTVSNKHLLSTPFEYTYTAELGRGKIFSHGPYFACHHICHRCSNDDINGIGFTDSGNYECDETKDIQKWEEELSSLEREINDLKYKIQRGKERWAELWESDKDAT